MKKLAVLAFVLSGSIALSACATTSEMPLAPNVVRLDTQASGLLFVGAAPAITMKKAASMTIARGYTHFRLEQASTSSGSRLVGMNSNSYGNVSGTRYGNTVSGSYSGSTFTSPVYAPTASVGVTVIMYHAGDAGAKGAWDAAEVLKKQGKV